MMLFSHKKKLAYFLLWTLAMHYSVQQGRGLVLAHQEAPGGNEETNHGSNSQEVASNDVDTMDSLGPILVVGATGATGKHVVKHFLDQGREVRVIVRSKERMMESLQAIDTKPFEESKLIVTEASVLDVSDSELEEQVQGVDAAISCLGHNMDFQGLFGHPRRLVTDATKRITTAMNKVTSSNNDTIKKSKFILMGSDGVANPNGADHPRTFVERTVVFLLRYLLPPHADNEEAAAYLHSLKSDINDSTSSHSIEWVVVRPTDLIDNDTVDGKYVLHDKPQGSLFGSGGTASRCNVAKAMFDLVNDATLWEKYKFTMPVMYDDANAKLQDQTRTKAEDL